MSLYLSAKELQKKNRAVSFSHDFWKVIVELLICWEQTRNPKLASIQFAFLLTYWVFLSTLLPHVIMFHESTKPV